jgi:hypothetical protein
MEKFRRALDFFRVRAKYNKNWGSTRLLCQSHGSVDQHFFPKSGNT